VRRFSQVTGIVDKILTSRYGKPMVIARDDAIDEWHWNMDVEERHSVLYMGAHLPNTADGKKDDLTTILGACVGGSILHGSLKIASRRQFSAYGLYTVEELRSQPEVRSALCMIAKIHFFMDASNIWFYGLHQGHLYVYDAETGELENLRSFERAFIELLQEWEEAACE